MKPRTNRPWADPVWKIEAARQYAHVRDGGSYPDLIAQVRHLQAEACANASPDDRDGPWCEFGE